MTIGVDIENVLEEIGTAFTIKRDSGDITGEYLDAETNAQVTKPFIREFFLEVMFQYNTEVVSGDIIDLDDIIYQTAHISSSKFEGNSIWKEGVLYKCNTSGELLRPSGEGGHDPVSYRVSTSWTTVRSVCYGTMVNNDFGTRLEESEFAQIDIEKMFLFIPKSYNPQPLDRYIAVSGENPYKIESVDNWRFDGIVVCELAEDTR